MSELPTIRPFAVDECIEAGHSILTVTSELAENETLRELQSDLANTRAFIGTNVGRHFCDLL